MEDLITQSFHPACSYMTKSMATIVEYRCEMTEMYLRRVKPPAAKSSRPGDLKKVTVYELCDGCREHMKDKTDMVIYMDDLRDVCTGNFRSSYWDDLSDEEDSDEYDEAK